MTLAISLVIGATVILLVNSGIQCIGYLGARKAVVDKKRLHRIVRSAIISSIPSVYAFIVSIINLQSKS